VLPLKKVWSEPTVIEIPTKTTENYQAHGLNGPHLPNLPHGQNGSQGPHTLTAIS